MARQGMMDATPQQSIQNAFAQRMALVPVPTLPSLPVVVKKPPEQKRDVVSLSTFAWGTGIRIVGSAPAQTREILLELSKPGVLVPWRIKVPASDGSFDVYLRKDSLASDNYKVRAIIPLEAGGTKAYAGILAISYPRYVPPVVVKPVLRKVVKAPKLDQMMGYHISKISEFPRPIGAPVALSDFIAQRVNRYGTIVEKTASQLGVDSNLVRGVIAIESQGKLTALGTKGEKGLMQLMPETAEGYRVTDLFDPSQNIRAGTSFLAYLMKKYKNNELLALAAYNWGPGNVDAWLAGKKRSIPAIVQSYVNKVLAAKKSFESRA